MISEKLQDAINVQINKELYSEYLYFSMAAWCASMNMAGFENFFIVQAQEEHFHTMKFYNYLNERGGRVILDKIEKPTVDFESVEEIFEMTLKHEQFITKSINELMDVAISENDHATRSFLNWYIDEQVEEESSMEAILGKLSMIGGKGQGLLMLDKELSLRTYTPPATQ